MIASIFEGSGSLDNLVPMNGNLNKGEWKKIENSWAKAIEAGEEVQVKIKPSYNGNSQRPVSFEIQYSLDGIMQTPIKFKNKPGG